MRRSVPGLVMTIVILSGLVSGCNPRHPPHTPQPIPEAPAQPAGPVDQPPRG